jgi:hypothetical protein
LLLVIFASGFCSILLGAAPGRAQTPAPAPPTCEGPEGSGGSIGKSFNLYNRRDGKWHQTWVDGSGSRLDLVGGLVEGRMVLGGTTPTRTGGEALHEVTWERLDGGAVKQHWRTSVDGGETWADSFVGIYKKK